MADKKEETKKPFVFKQSVLSAKADEMWNQTKLGFAASKPTGHIQLEKKSLDDVLSKMAAERKEREDKQKEKPAFVFGSNIADRVKIDQSAVKDNGSTTGTKAEDLFKNIAQKTEQLPEKDTEQFRAEAVAAAEKLKEEEKQHASTSIVNVTTGEEDDDVVFQTGCKLHIFDKDKSKWVEKGLAQIKINKMVKDGDVHHRIVARTTGNHRVVINSHVFSDMMLERVDQKRIKISALGPDSPVVQIFLITISFSKTDFNVDNFYECLKQVHSLSGDSNTRKRKANDDSSEDKTVAKNKKEDVKIGEEEATLGSNEEEIGKEVEETEENEGKNEEKSEETAESSE